MMSPNFESLVVNSLTILADEPDDATAMVWNEAETQAELEGNEKAIYRLDLNDKEILLEDIEDLIAYDKIHKVKDFRLDKNEFFDEGVELFPVDTALTEEGLDSFLTMLWGDNGQALKQLYSQPGLTPGEIHHAVVTDYFMAFGMRRWAEYQQAIGQPTFFYFMDHVPPAFHLYMSEPPELSLPGGPRSGGAYHSGDLALVFGNTDKVGFDWNEVDRKVSKNMMRYWVNFARSGDPNGDQVPLWPAFNPVLQSTQVINEVPTTVQGVRRRQLDIMAMPELL